MGPLRLTITVITLVVLLNLAGGARLKGRRRVPKEAPGPVTIPSGFVKLAHKVSSGEVIIKDKRTILIRQFSYDGAGPDAYFWIGKGSPTDSNAIIKGRKTPDENGGYDVLQGYENQDIELLLPADITINDIDYLSVYCVSFHHLFGYVKIPAGLNVPEYGG